MEFGGGNPTEHNGFGLRLALESTSNSTLTNETRRQRRVRQVFSKALQPKESQGHQRPVQETAPTAGSAKMAKGDFCTARPTNYSWLESCLWLGLMTQKRPLPNRQGSSYMSSASPRCKGNWPFKKARRKTRKPPKGGP